MSLILSIETSTKVCSVALHEQGILVARNEIIAEKSHGEILTVLTKNIISGNGFNFNQIDAIAISKGPGSYTGLRIGTSTAKGLCYALEKPLIAINTLQAMAYGLNQQFVKATIQQLQFPISNLKSDPEYSGRNSKSERRNPKDEIRNLKSEIRNPKGEIRKAKSEIRKAKSERRNPKSEILICPMLDARRMEVFYAMFNTSNEFIKDTSAEIIDEFSFKDVLSASKVIFFGDGMDKCRPILSKHENAIFIDDIFPSAKNIGYLATNRYKENDFEDVAYFEPFYLKDFVSF